MTKRITALLLAVMMLLAFSACDNGSTPPPPSGGDGTQGGGTAAGGNDTNAPGGLPSDTELPVVTEYQPDPDCPYRGYVGFGTTAGTFYVDNIALLDQGVGKFELIPQSDCEDASALPEFHALGATDAIVPEVVDDPLTAEGETATNHAVAAKAGETFMTGEKDWNFYQYKMKVYLADTSSSGDIYFNVTDENNYYVLSFNENGTNSVTCYKVTDGTKVNAQFTIIHDFPADAWTSVGITTTRTYIDIYIGGEMLLQIGNDEMVNNFYPYNGTDIPLSVMPKDEGGYAFGAPHPESVYLPVDPENVIHDGKGTYQNSTSTLPTMVFNKQVGDTYDCDETCGTENDENMNVAMYDFDNWDGDTTKTGYVGAYFEQGVTLTHIRWFGRAANANRNAGGYFEASEDGTTWVTLATIEANSACTTFETLAVAEDYVETVFHYVRYVSPKDGYCNMSEIEFWGQFAG